MLRLQEKIMVMHNGTSHVVYFPRDRFLLSVNSQRPYQPSHRFNVKEATTFRSFLKATSTVTSTPSDLRDIVYYISPLETIMAFFATSTPLGSCLPLSRSFSPPSPPAFIFLCYCFAIVCLFLFFSRLRIFQHARLRGCQP